jgi:hypothetical protein
MKLLSILAILLFAVSAAAQQQSYPPTLVGGTVNPSSLSGMIVIDGQTNPTIQAGLNKVTSPGQKVFLPAGTYTLASNLSFLSIPINFECADKNSTILNFTATSGNAMTIWAGSRVSNCDIRGPGTGSGIGINMGTDVWTANTVFTTTEANLSPTYANENGHIYKETVASCTTAMVTEPTWPTSVGATVNDNTCTWQENGITGAEIYNNIIEGFGNVQINMGSYAYGWRVHDNLLRNGTVVSPPTEALLIGGNSQMNAVYANRIENFQGNGVDLNGSRNSVYYNTFNNIGASKNGTNSFCIDIVGVTTSSPHSDDNWIEGNVCNTTGGAAMFMGAQASSTVSRNKIMGNTFIGCNETDTFGDCVKLGANAGAGTLDQNEFIGNNIQTAQRYGLTIDSSGGATITNTKVQGNTISGSGAADLVLNNVTGTLVEGNHFLSGTPYVLAGSNAPIFWGQNNPQTNGFSFNEVAAPAAQANAEICYGDSTAHALKCAYNNGSFNLLPTVTAADTTTTHVLHATATGNVFTASAIATGDLPTAIPIANVGSAGLSGTAPATISAAGAIGCATCVTSAASITSNVLPKGSGGAQGVANSLLTDSGTVLTYTGTGGAKGAEFIANTGTVCTNGELALSANWGASATATLVAGTGQTCQWTITANGTTGANPTVTDTLTNALPAATTVCDMRMVGGTGTATLINQTSLSATAPIFTFGGTPVSLSTYIVVRRCGP